jgi:hypothetical protein
MEACRMSFRKAAGISPSTHEAGCPSRPGYQCPWPPEQKDQRRQKVLGLCLHLGTGLPDGKLPPVPLQFDPATGRPRSWPLRYTIVYWAALAADLRPGSYRLRCRTIDANGVAQPMPRPFPKSGNNAIHQVPLVVEA